MMQYPQGQPVPQQAGASFGNHEDVHPVALTALLLLSILALVLPRRWLVVPLAILICFIPDGQRLVLFTLDFSFTRLLLMVAWLRMLLRGEVGGIRLNHMDRAFIAFVSTMVVAGTILTGSIPGFINRAGFAFDALAAYFLFRHLIRGWDDLRIVAATFFIISLPVLCFFIVENRTHHNLFAAFGGVPELTEIREGRLRCQGAFSHSILAGCFWASLMPLFALLGLVWRRWSQATLAMLVACGLVVLCASSTPAVSVLVGGTAASLYLIRSVVPWIRNSMLVAAVCLHMIMKAPVWQLVARIDLAGGSTGYHRFRLIDAAIRHFPEWMLAGTLSTANWGWGLTDVTNHYIGVGVGSGALGLLLFLVVIVMGFVGVSNTMRCPGLPREYKFAAWALGCMLFMHCTNFIGVSYFGQIQVLWYMTLATISSLCLVPGSPGTYVAAKQPLRPRPAPA